MKKIKAFSLIELMISLIVISCIIAAFIPVISKKLNSSNVSVTGNSTSDITTECSDKFSSSCKLCTKSYCIQCELSSCAAGTYPESKSCTCKSCSNIFSNCATCDNSKCTKCINNNYYIDNGKCMDCPTGKLCDGINAYDETICDNPPSGYFCDGNVLKTCTSKYSMYCTSCNATKCLSCSSSYYLKDNSCFACSDQCIECESATKCLKCTSGAVLDTNNLCSKPCSAYMPNCRLCEGANVCTQCNGGYYLENASKCSSCSIISNCSTCTSSTQCEICNTGFYVNSSGKCSKCTISNCAVCDINGTCLTCNQGYHPSEDKKSCESNSSDFDCSDPNFIKIGNLCYTRKNMGDSLMLPIPYTVNIAQTGSDYCYSQSQKCCWKGTTATPCDSNNGSYSGCERTVCNWNAANEICTKFNYAGKNWRLAYNAEMHNWGIYAVNLGDNGLMVCDYAAGYGLARCVGNKICYGAYNNECTPQRIWGEKKDDYDAYMFSSGQGVTSVYGTSKYSAYSVRCVTEME